MSYEISVVIPVYNVEDYLEECMQSLLTQTFQDFEVIVINDGSTDGTELILKNYLKVMSNLLIINQENSGSAGGPRNIGIKSARGKYICFLDPDDTLPINSLEVLHNAMKEQNVEIVCGCYTRFNSKRMWTLKHTVEGIFSEKLVTSFIEYPNLANNIIACNKLFSSKFLRENQIYFNEKLRYAEDRSFILKAYACAKQIMIIPDVIYNYRVRENKGNKSATQNFSLKTFKESIEACIESYESFERFGMRELLAHLFTNERVQQDLIRFIDFYILTEKTDKQWDGIFDLADGYIRLAKEHLSSMTYIQRVKIYFLLERDLDKLRKVFKKQRSLYFYRSKEDNGDLSFVDHSIRGNNALPSSIRKVSISDLKEVYKLNNLSITKGNLLSINGWVFFKRISTTISKSLVLMVNGKELKLKLKNKFTPSVSLKFGKGYLNYNYAGFEGSFELNNLISQDGELKIYLELETGDGLSKKIYLEKFFYKGEPESSRLINSNTITQRIESIKYSDQGVYFKGWALVKDSNYKNYNDFNKRLVFVNDEGKEICFALINRRNVWVNKQLEINPYGIYEYDYSGWEIMIPYRNLPVGNYNIYIEIESDKTTIRDKLKYPGWVLIANRKNIETPYFNFGNRYIFQFSSSEYNREECSVTLSIQSIDTPHNELNGGAVINHGNKSDYWNIKSGLQQFLIKRIRVTKIGLGLEGTHVGNTESHYSLVLLMNDENNNTCGYKCKTYKSVNGEENSGWNVFIPYADLKDSQYSLTFMVNKNGNHEILTSYFVSKNLNKNLNVWANHFIRNIKMSLTKGMRVDSNAFNIEVHLNRNISNIFLGLYTKIKKRLIRNIYRINKRPFKKTISKCVHFCYKSSYKIFSLLPIKNKVVFATYQTKLPSDFLTIDSVLKEKRYRIVYLYGNNKSFHELLLMSYHFATAKVVFLNSYYRHLYNLNHRKQTKFVQLWHATGIFKRFGLLSVGKEDSNSKDFEMKAHHYYTEVYTSGDKITGPYSKAFGLPLNKIKAIGVPRTDVFFDVEKKIEITRKLSEILPQTIGKKIILYAPTFRGGNNERKIFKNRLDLNNMNELREQNYLLLYKMHPSVEEPLWIPENLKDFVIDVTNYPDINELFFITDILISDYSSSIFEFALFNKPIIFFAYDLKRYLNERGFYYQYDEFVPGPIFEKSESIKEYILNLESEKVDHSQFVLKYMNKIDGKSTERILKDLLLN